MKRIVILLTAGVALWAATAAAGAGARPAKVTVSRTALGRILTNGRGFTLYVFTRDAPRRDRCQGVRGCKDVWPVLKTSARPVAGPGVMRSRLGTIKLSDGTRQVTYAGHPLYLYAGDFGPRQTSYVGIQQFGGRWYAIDAAGHVVK